MFKIDYTNYKNESKKDKGKDKEQNNLKNQINGITKRKPAPSGAGRKNFTELRRRPVIRKPGKG